MDLKFFKKATLRDTSNICKETIGSQGLHAKSRIPAIDGIKNVPNFSTEMTLRIRENDKNLNREIPVLNIILCNLKEKRQWYSVTY